jgi:predicted phosphate transport protein (TIGR00153 family)
MPGRELVRGRVESPGQATILAKTDSLERSQPIRREQEIRPMLHWFRRLLPREERFFDLFARHADTVVRGAEQLCGMLEGGEAVQRHFPAVLAAEEEADAITREVVQAVRRTFVTPFDRGDIQALIGRMDDTIDQMKKAAKAIVFFEMTALDGDYRRMGDAILRAAKLQREVLPLLARISPNAARISLICEQIRQVEGEADDIHDSGVTELYRQARPEEALRFIAAREVFDLLEKVVDRFDDAANEIENIVVEHV